MKIGYRSRIVIVVAIVLASAWVYTRYYNGAVETYALEKEDLLRKISTDVELKPVLTMVSVAKLTKERDLAQRAYELAVANDRDELVKLVERL